VLGDRIGIEADGVLRSRLISVFFFLHPRERDPIVRDHAPIELGNETVVPPRPESLEDARRLVTVYVAGDLGHLIRTCLFHVVARDLEERRQGG
jgi:hypothetical protein